MKKYQLPKEFATKWVEALRSGEYKQTDVGLADNNCYCCLGVACVISGATYTEIESQGTTITDWLSTIEPHILKISDKLFYNKIPNEIKGNAVDNELVEKLVGLNDTGTPFPEIADWIESYVEFI